jgi:hypothetical protein
MAHVGGTPNSTYSCDELVDNAFETGCTCREPSYGHTIEAFQGILEPFSGEALNDVNSPQFKALNWIVNDDPANLSVGGTTPDETIQTRYVAAVLYYALGGVSWATQYDFLSDRDICTWNLDSSGPIYQNRIREGYHTGCGSNSIVETLQLCNEFQNDSSVLAHGIICGADGNVETLRLRKFQRLNELIAVISMRVSRTISLSDHLL